MPLGEIKGNKCEVIKSGREGVHRDHRPPRIPNLRPTPVTTVSSPGTTLYNGSRPGQPVVAATVPAPCCGGGEGRCEAARLSFLYILLLHAQCYSNPSEALLQSVGRPFLSPRAFKPTVNVTLNQVPRLTWW